MSLDHTGNVNYWSQRWDEKKIGWHKTAVNPNLIANFERLTQSDNPGANTPKKVFIPLCGKTIDIAYVLQQGHQVLGVEAVAKAILELEEENNLGLKFNEEESTYQTDDGQLRIFCGDLFKEGFQNFIQKYGPADVVWDRGSFIALEFPYRLEYIKTIQSALQVSPGQYHDFRYLLETLDYDKEKYGGPPRAVNDDDMQKYFAPWVNIEIVSKLRETEGAVSKVPEIGEFYQIVYFLTPKSHGAK